MNLVLVMRLHWTRSVARHTELSDTSRSQGDAKQLKYLSKND